METKSIDLTTTLSGPTHSIYLKNPIMTASGTFGHGYDFANYGDLNSLGGFVVKGLSLQPHEGNPEPRIAETTAGMLNSIGLQNDGLDLFCKNILPKLMQYETAVIVNLYAHTLEDFATLAKYLDTAPGIAALEINISCPNVKQGGMLFGQDPHLAANVTTAVRNSAPHKPIIVKLSPNVTDIVKIALAVEAAGADCINCINTVAGMAVDLRTRRSRLENIIGGLSGPAIKPIALRCVWQVANAVSIPVIGTGGIVCAEDVLEFIMCGAHAVQIGTGNFIRPDCAFKIVEELPEICAKFGINDLHKFRGSLETCAF